MTETNVDRLKRFSDSVLGGRMDEAVALLHPDFSVREAASLPYGGVYNGVEGWNELWTRVSGKWQDLAIVADEPLGVPDGDQFGWMMTMSGTSVDSGNTFSMTVFERWTLKDNLIYEILPHYWDVHAIAEIDAPSLT